MTQYSGKVIRKTPVTPTQQSASGVWKLNEQAAAIRNNSWPVPGVPDPISRSVRLRSSASAYVTRTFGNPTNNLKWTYSVWFKKGVMNSGTLFSNAGAGNGSVSNTFQYLLMDFNGSQGGQLEWRQVNNVGSITAERQPTMLLRDPSAWYHLVCVWDSANATAGNRMLMYLNGVQITSFTASVDPSSSLQSYINSNGYIHDIGASFLGGSRGGFFDGYMTEINFIDGQALTPSSFGTTDTATGAWIPMAYTGTYGANGFYLNFKDNTSTTTLGYDYSGNSNNWTANNISLTAGTTYDSMLDVPTPWVGYSTTTDTSAVTRGNYCVINPIQTSYGVPSITNANLSYSCAGAGSFGAAGTIAVSSGKWYWEINPTALAASDTMALGIREVSGNPTAAGAWNGGVSGSYIWRSDGFKRNNGTTTAYGTAYTTSNVIGIALDLDSGTLTFYKDNVSQGTAYSGVSGTFQPAFATDQSSGTTTASVNFGQRPLSYTPPSGYKTLVTTNLPTPTITNGANYFAASTYTGTGANGNVIVNSANNAAGISFQPDLVWAKGRSMNSNSNVVDSVRGTTKYIYTSLTDAEGTWTDKLVSFNSNGFTLNADQVGTGQMNTTNGGTYVAWQWKASNASGVTNTSGSITSSVSANTTAGFSVVTYTGTGTNATVGHGLGVAPNMIIAKNRTSGTPSWRVYHSALPYTSYLYLDNTNAAFTGGGVWTQTPSSTVFGINGSDAGVNSNGAKYVAYCWAQVAGYSAFGSYTGNGSTDGPFVYCGFRPRYVLVKASSATENWLILDSSTGAYNVISNTLLPNSSAAESTGNDRVDFLSNGFKARASAGVSPNASGVTYIFAAFAEVPFKFANSR